MRSTYSLPALFAAVTTAALSGCENRDAGRAGVGIDPVPMVACGNAAQGSSTVLETDVLIYGATPSGIMAAIEAAHLGKRVVLLEPTSRLGGKFGNGIGIGEVKNIDIIGGRTRTFFSQLASFYGFARDVDATKFEPKAAGFVMKSLLCGQSGIQVKTESALTSVTKNGTHVDSVQTENGNRYVAKVFIDASYEGDLLAQAGVSYTVGREASSEYGESLAGVGVYSNANNSQFDPYVVPGDPSSGVIPLIDPAPPGKPGSADRRIQAYTYRVCVTANPANRVPFTAPDGYDPALFEAVARMVAYKQANGDSFALSRLITLQGLPNGKFDVNNVKDISVDHVGPSYEYPEATPVRRQEIAQQHERFVKGFMYYLATSPRLPKQLRDEASALGYCKDEYTDNGNFPPQMYVREGRRMLGTSVMTQGTILNKTAPQPIGLGVYWIDVHTVSLFANRGIAQAEGHLFTEVDPYQIPYSVLTPKPEEATNLLVTVCISASHVAFASMRVEPSYMIMGQSAGAAAAMAIDQGTSVQGVDYGALSRHLLEDGQRLSVGGS